MKRLITPIFLLLVSYTATAQTKEIAQKEFLDAVNKLAATVKIQHWAYEEPFTIDSAFNIVGDSLTATFRYKTDTGFYRIRYAAPIKELKGVFQDMYLILSFKNRSVHVYDQIGNGNWGFVERRSMFHIGLIDDEEKKHIELKDEIEWTVEELMEYYK